MFWVEVYGGKRSLAFELTTAILWLETHDKHALGAMATMDDYASSQVRDGSLFMGMTGSGKNRTGFENFSCHGDGLCVFFLNKETGL